MEQEISEHTAYRKACETCVSFMSVGYMFAFVYVYEGK